MSKVDDIFNQLGQTNKPASSELITVSSGNPETQPAARYKLSKKDLLKVLDKMPDEAAIWNTMEGEAEQSAMNAIKDALWRTVEPAVKRVIKAPTGNYMESNDRSA